MFMSNKASPSRGAGGHYGHKKKEFLGQQNMSISFTYVHLLKAYNLHNLV